MNELTLEVQKREATGTNANRRLRAGGNLPGVVYGGGKDSVPIQLDRSALHKLLKQGGENAVFLLKLAGTKESRHAMVRHLDIQSVSRQIQHIDFQRVLLDQKVRVQVQVSLVGEAVGVKNDGGVLDFITRTVEVECLPTDIPAALEVDVADLHIGQHVEISGIEVPAGVEIVDDPSRVILAVAQSRVAASLEVEEGEEEEELLESELEEPELIGKGKEEVEEEGA
ncbi:MAG: 50S ribosomal protein L25 [Acidobacteriota bacterium]|nr:50S ribosomal protein L25 [Acidobacteriota bacterium]